MTSCCRDRAGSRPALARRGLHAAGWVGPTAALVLMPKCPACVGAYIAAGTGIGVSVSAASYLRTGAIALSVISLAVIAVLTLRRFL